MLLMRSENGDDVVTIRTAFTTPLLLGVFGSPEYVIDIFGCKEIGEGTPPHMPEAEMPLQLFELLDDIGVKMVGEYPPDHIRIAPSLLPEESRANIPRYTKVSAVILDLQKGQLDGFCSLFPEDFGVVVGEWALSSLDSASKYHHLYLQRGLILSPQWRHFCALLGYDPEETVRAESRIARKDTIAHLYTDVHVDPKALKRSIEEASSLPFVVDIRLPPEGDSLSVVFNDVIHEDGYGNEHLISSPTLTILWKRGYGSKMEIEARHPHVTPYGRVCWGGFAPFLDEELEKHDIGGVASVTWEFLNSYNPEDAYFLWEEQEQDEL